MRDGTRAVTGAGPPSPRRARREAPAACLQLEDGHAAPGRRRVVPWGLISSIGLLLTHVLVSGPLRSADLSVDVWFAARPDA